jgi:hypothetical protein
MWRGDEERTMGDIRKLIMKQRKNEMRTNIAVGRRVVFQESVAVRGEEDGR